MLWGRGCTIVAGYIYRLTVYYCPAAPQLKVQLVLPTVPNLETWQNLLQIPVLNDKIHIFTYEL